MSTVVTLPTQLTALDAWERYASLVRQANDDRTLWANVEHCKAVARAYSYWMDVFLRSEAAA